MAGKRFRRIVAVIVFGAVLAALGTTAYCYQRDLQRARDRLAAGSEIADTPCGPIEYATAGAGTAVLIVHGAGGGFDQGLELGAPLVERGFRVIAMSRFGYLRTPLPADASPAAQADAHACLLDALGIRRIAVLGASAGAPSAMQLALRHPQRLTALVLMVPAAYVPRPGGAPALTRPRGPPWILDVGLRSDFLFWAMSRLAHRVMIRAVLGTPPELVDRASPAERVRIEQMLDHILPVSPRRFGLLNEGVVVPALPRYPLEQIHTPTLIISAADDLYGTYEPARYTAAHIPGARFVGYSSGGHLLVGHQPEVTDELVRFLK